MFGRERRGGDELEGLVTCCFSFAFLSLMARHHSSAENGALVLTLGGVKRNADVMPGKRPLPRKEVSP